MSRPRNKLSPEGLAHVHRVALQSLRMSFPGQQRYRDAVLLIYMIEDCIGPQTPTMGLTVRARYPREKFRELKQ
jgi:hypothetical protein